MALDALSGRCLFFYQQRRNQVKLWEGDGLSLYYNRWKKAPRAAGSWWNHLNSCACLQQLRFIFLQGSGFAKNTVSQSYQKNCVSYAHLEKMKGLCLEYP
jgi:hypothetical protein